jgi:hypothetical protein
MRGWLTIMNKSAMYLMYLMYLFCKCEGVQKNISYFLGRLQKTGKMRDIFYVLDPVFRFIHVH